jgi:hypothetical protein
MTDFKQPTSGLVHFVLADAPASGATKNVWISSGNCGVGWKVSDHFRSLRLAITSSHDSAASGVVVENTDSMDPALHTYTASTSWTAAVDNAGNPFPVTYLTAGGRAVYEIPVLARHMRIRYINSASVLTNFFVELFGVRHTVE